MDYTSTNATTQSVNTLKAPVQTGCLLYDDGLDGFIQTSLPIESKRLVINWGRRSGKPKEVTVLTIPGYIKRDPVIHARGACPNCGGTLHIHDSVTTTLKHVPHGNHRVNIEVSRVKLRCHKCGAGFCADMPFKARNHRITVKLLQYIETLLSRGLLLKDVAWITGLDEGTVKDIDKARLQRLYTDEGRGDKLIMPPRCAHLGIDEFSVESGHRYATIIMDMVSGAVIWVAYGKGKQAVKDFIDHVGLDWMSGVKTVCMDMNASFQDAFKEACPHIEIIYDFYHIKSNFLKKVVEPIRKDEQARLMAEGHEAEAKALKNQKYILLSDLDTLKEQDREAREIQKAQAEAKAQEEQAKAEGKDVPKTKPLFGTPKRHTPRANREERYRKLIDNNELFFTCDLIKEMVDRAFKRKQRKRMEQDIDEIIETCRSTDNTHMKWFANLLESHKEGIVTHAKWGLSSGKVEGTVNMIKTIKKRGYGYPDTEYFFLKIMDESRKKERF